MKTTNLRVWTVAAAIAVAAVLGITTTWADYAADSKPKTHIVEIRNLEFAPTNLKVSPGDTIKWINYDVVPHTVTSKDKSWDSGHLDKDQSWELVVTDKTYKDYFCKYHPTMIGKIDI